MIILLSILFNYQDSGQFINYTTLFGILIGASLLSNIKWERTEFFKGGIVLGVVSVLLINLFLPGRALSGWNPNSAIIITPAALLALSLIYYSSNKCRIMCYLIIAVALLSSIKELSNRSSLLAVCMLALLPLVTKNRILKKKNLLRVVCYGVLLLNIGLPFLQADIKTSSFYQDIQELSADLTDKSDNDFHGRDILWIQAIERVNDSPIFGKFGHRDAYFHNFSCDVLTQFGWVGWFAFAFIYVVLIEKCYDSKHPKTNIFLLAFACLLLLNCFENAFLANGYFTIYPYFFFAIAWRLKTHPIE
jgi:hypothetical protein